MIAKNISLFTYIICFLVEVGKKISNFSSLIVPFFGHFLNFALLEYL